MKDKNLLSLENKAAVITGAASGIGEGTARLFAEMNASVALLDIDETKGKKTEEEIKYLKEYNERILESNPNPIIVIKGKEIEYVNSSFISNFGKTKDNFIYYIIFTPFYFSISSF